MACKEIPTASVHVELCSLVPFQRLACPFDQCTIFALVLCLPSYGVAVVRLFGMSG